MRTQHCERASKTMKFYNLYHFGKSEQAHFPVNLSSTPSSPPTPTWISSTNSKFPLLRFAGDRKSFSMKFEKSQPPPGDALSWRPSPVLSGRQESWIARSPCLAIRDQFAS